MPVSTNNRRVTLCAVAAFIGGLLGYAYIAAPHQIFAMEPYTLITNVFSIRIWGALMLIASCFAVCALVARTALVAFVALTSLAVIEAVFSILFLGGEWRVAKAAHLPGWLALVTSGVYLAMALYTALAALSAHDMTTES